MRTHIAQYHMFDPYKVEYMNIRNQLYLLNSRYHHFYMVMTGMLLTEKALNL